MIYAAVYWLAIKLYAAMLHIAAWFNPKAKLFVDGRKWLLLRIKTALQNEYRPRIWMHCASLGEFEQGRPVLEQLRAIHPDYAVILTFFSPSGYEVRKDYDGADYIFYLPMDGPVNAKRFLNVIQPSLCIFVKYELWYYYLRTIAKRNIKAILISAVFRKSQPFFQWYGSLHRKMLQCFTHLFVQDNASQRLLAGIGISNVTVSGDTRFDRVVTIAKQNVDLPIATAFLQGRKTIVAGSTWPSDEDFLQQVLQQLPSHWCLILAPHEINEAHLESIEKIFEGNTIRWSQWSTGINKRVLIVDNIGYLSQLYHYATISWIGGGFDNDGVHNVLEAAVHARPCAYGPVYDKYVEAKALVESGGAMSITHAQEMAKQIAVWEHDEKQYQHAANVARQYVLANAGATEKIVEYLFH